MKPTLFYSIPLLVYIVVNNGVAYLTWPYFLIVLLSFLLFQMARLRFPKGAILPLTAKMTNAAFYITTVAFAFRDQFLSPTTVNTLIGITICFAIADLRQTKKEPSI
ncbi:hypothetical protein B0H99_101164 [Planomicrobium soli]|uniref:Uncharacterized protein n=1 Tax=Planomicrobium soli TaxID=1176648 RepID=A0A2P8H6R8_9BACL|nr:hypothetical protein [Planomicrobium soli]PSL41918.1 hypothetical protein B0H99_101164 [Planomicrobium soli]